MSNTPATPPATWSTSGVSLPEFDVLSQQASLRFSRQGGGPRLISDERMFGGLLQHLAVQLRNLPELVELRRCRAELDALPGDTMRHGCAGFTQMVSSGSGAPGSQTIDFRQRDALMGKLREASQRAVAAVQRALESTSDRGPGEIAADILQRVEPLLEELAMATMRGRLCGLSEGGQTVAQKLVDAMSQ